MSNLADSASEPEETDKASIDAINNAASDCRTLWATFMGYAATLFILVAGTTHENLLRQTPVKLPLFNVDTGIPLVLFYIVAPLLLVLFHLNLLMKLHDLRLRVRALTAPLNGRCDENVKKIRGNLRRKLVAFDYALLKSDLVTDGRERWLLSTVAYTTIFVMPVVLLLFVQLQFLPYHNSGYSWIHRLFVALDLALIAYIQLWLSTGPSSETTPSFLSRLSAARRAFVRIFAVPKSPRAYLRMALFTVPLLISVIVFAYPGKGTEFDLLWRNLQTESHTVAGTDLSERFFIKRSLNLRRGTFWAANPPPEILAVYEGDRLNKANGSDNRLEAQRRYGRPMNLADRDLSYADLFQASLIDANLSGAELKRVELADAELQGIDLRGADLQDAMLEGSRLQDAALGDANMRRASLKATDLQGAFFTNTQLQGADLSLADLQGVDLSQVQMQGANLEGALLQVTNLRGAQLQGANLRDAHLEGADLTCLEQNGQGGALLCAQLQGADLSAAKAQGADFSSADLQGAILSLAAIKGAAFRRSEITLADLSLLNLDDDFDFASMKADTERQNSDASQKMAFVNRLSHAKENMAHKIPPSEPLIAGAVGQNFWTDKPGLFGRGAKIADTKNIHSVMRANYVVGMACKSETEDADPVDVTRAIAAQIVRQAYDDLALAETLLASDCAKANLKAGVVADLAKRTDELRSRAK